MNYTFVTFILNYQKTIKSNWELLFQSASSREKVELSISLPVISDVL